MNAIINFYQVKIELMDMIIARTKQSIQHSLKLTAMKTLANKQKATSLLIAMMISLGIMAQEASLYQRN